MKDIEASAVYVPTPKELMRARRPELFSDTLVSDEQHLAKPVFEYHLETLTSRKQEYEFEHFCRKIAEKEICPNLRFQTGPTGGGDSKVDTETYPVAEEISERWWVGEPSAGAERWAFAFSAKKAWKPKLKSDVDNILSTDRDYKRIYFFTNQFVSDKDRASQEDKLIKHAGIPVHIIDRAWIVEKVYESGYLDLAVSALGIEGVTTTKRERLGPRDTARMDELEELDRQVADPTRYQGARYQLVEDCLRSAVLARGLERPRPEVESRFAQADRLARTLNFRQQQARIAYNRAWTAFWWYEDYSDFIKYYNEVEKFLEGTDQASDTELLLNLWQLLASSVSLGRISADEAKVDVHRKNLSAILESMTADTVRQNNSLWARTELALMKISNVSTLEECWRDLMQILDESAGLADYPVMLLADIIKELGNQIDSDEFDILFEKIIDIVRQRSSDGEAGKAFIERGTHKLQQEKPYDAIRWFGKAEELLVKKEYREELAHALISSSYAYERAGLLWAARSKILAAIERCFAFFKETGEIVPVTVLATKRLVWLELQLGRIPSVLNAVSLFRFTLAHVNISVEKKDKCIEDYKLQDSILGIHFLNASYSDLHALEKMPDVLSRLELSRSRMALLFVLGYEEKLRDEYGVPEAETSEDLQEFFKQWQSQPAAEDMPSMPILMNNESSLLASTMLGAKLTLVTPNNYVSFGLAESILGAIESFVATSNETEVIPHRETIKLEICVGDNSVAAPKIIVSRWGDIEKILHPACMSITDGFSRKDYVDWVVNLIGQIISRLLIIKDVKSWLTKLAEDERVYGRALIFSDSLTLNSNVFGRSPKFSLGDWFEPTDQEYPLRRDRPWRTAKGDAFFAPEESGDTPPQFGPGTSTADFPDLTHLKHTERGILSPIDIHLWNQAGWGGVAFLFFPPSSPGMALTFGNGEAGKSIFEGWQTRWGFEDKDDELRIVIVRGLSRSNPSEYGIIVGPNLESVSKDPKKVFVFVSRVNRMTPTSPANLENFLESFRRFGVFFLMPAQLKNDMPDLFPEKRIKKTHLHIREAWQINENDPDASVLHDDDDPIVPDDVKDPPVKMALERLKALKKNNQIIMK